MNKPVIGEQIITLPLPKVVDDELANDIEKESVFVSPYLDRIVIEDDHQTASLHISGPSHLEEVVDKAERFLAVMAKRVSGFDVKVFLENKRRDEQPYETDVNAKLVEQSDQIIGGGLDQEGSAHRLRLAMPAHIPGQCSVAWREGSDLQIKHVMVEGRPVGQSDQRRVRRAVQPEMEWTAIAFENMRFRHHNKPYLDISVITKR